MNPRFEILVFLALMIIGGLFLLKSKRFDAFLEWVFKGTKPTTPSDIKKGAVNVSEAKETLKKNLDKQEASIKKAKTELDSI